MSVICIANQKGGSGKSTVTHAIAFEMAKKNKSVLLIDYDPQASLTKLCEGAKEFPDHFVSIAAVFDGDKPEIIPIAKNVSLIASEKKELRAAFGAGATGKEQKLKRYIKTVKDDYDYILIDCRPDMGVPIISAVLASDSIINPINAKGLDAFATSDFFEDLAEACADYDKTIENIYVLPFRTTNTRNSKEICEDIENDLPSYVKALPELSSVNLKIMDRIPERTAIAEAGGFQMDLRTYITNYKKDQKDILDLFSKLTKQIIKTEEGR